VTFPLPERQNEFRHWKSRLLHHWWFLHKRTVSNSCAIRIMHCKKLAIHWRTMVVHKLPSEIVWLMCIKIMIIPLDRWVMEVRLLILIYMLTTTAVDVKAS
jgi:hypothetical protein